MDIAGASISGPRPYNEDNYYFFDFAQSSSTKTFVNGIKAFIMVSDGMGGHEGGDVASALACKSAEDYMASLLSMEGEFIELDASLALTEIVENANEAISQYSTEQGIPNIGATFVGAFIGTNKAWIAHVGDSRAYKISRGKIEQITRDHSMVGRMLSDGLITEEQAQNHPQRNVIDSALGFTADDPEMNEVYLGRGDALILCSDGVSTVVSNEDMVKCLQVSNSVNDAADNLLDLAVKKHTDDNATAVVAVRNWSSMKARTPKPNTREQLTGRLNLKGLFANPRSRAITIIAALLLVAVVVLFAVAGGSGAGGGATPVEPTPEAQTTQGEDDTTAAPKDPTHNESSEAAGQDGHETTPVTQQEGTFVLTEFQSLVGDPEPIPVLEYVDDNGCAQYLMFSNKKVVINRAVFELYVSEDFTEYPFADEIHNQKYYELDSRYLELGALNTQLKGLLEENAAVLDSLDASSTLIIDARFVKPA